VVPRQVNTAYSCSALRLLVDAFPDGSGKAFYLPDALVRALKCPEARKIMFRSLTPEFFDTAVVVVIILGVAFSAVRLYADFTRPLSSRRRPAAPPSADDTAPE